MKFTLIALFSGLLLLVMPPVSASSAESETATVAETTEGGGYTYLKLEEPDIWIATSTLDVLAGDRVEYRGGMEMRNFYSKALERTFESIWFMQHVSVAERSLKGLHKEVMAENGSTSSSVALPTTAAAPKTGEIKKLEGGKTIAEITAAPSELNEKNVSLRVKVIKVNNDIMGKNWITLQDGTGSAPNDKLIATSAETVTAGDIVTAQGLVRTNVDLGSGYLYDILLEDATFSQ